MYLVWLTYSCSSVDPQFEPLSLPHSSSMQTKDNQQLSSLVRRWWLWANINKQSVDIFFLLSFCFIFCNNGSEQDISSFKLASLDFGKFRAPRSWLQACLQSSFEDFEIAWGEFFKLPIFLPNVYLSSEYRIHLDSKIETCVYIHNRRNNQKGSWWVAN